MNHNNDMIRICLPTEINAEKNNLEEYLQCICRGELINLRYIKKMDLVLSLIHVFFYNIVSAFITMLEVI